MNFVIENKERFTLIRSQVEKLDTNHAPELKSILVQLNGQGVKNIVVDLSNTRYCDSSGLSAILVASRLCKGAEGTFILTELQDPVMKLITISQLHTVLNIVPTLKEAEDFIIMDEISRDAEGEGS